MRKRAMWTRLLAILMIVSFSTVGFPAKVSAWKIGTHVYSANIIIDELKKNGGSLEIKPFGKFAMNKEYADAILAFPEYYRAGAMGPDVIPDLYIGQMVYHPGTSSMTAGQLMDEVVGMAKNLPVSSDPGMSKSSIYANANQKNALTIQDKQQALAFSLGLTTHEAGDLFGHSYINKWAGGDWPALTDGATQDEINIVLKHNIIEAYIDKNVPGNYTDQAHKKIALPKQFVLSTLIGNGGAINTDDPAQDFNGIGSLYYNRDTHPQHIRTFYEIRDWVKANAAESEATIKDPKLKDYPFLPYYYAKAAYLEAWMQDIDEGLEAWVVTNEKVAQLLLESGGLKKAPEEYKAWAYEHLLKMLGAPDVGADVIKALGGVAAFVGELLPESLQKKVETLKIDFYDQILAWVFPDSQISYEKIEAISKDPGEYLRNSGLFVQGAETKLSNDLGNFSTVSDAQQITFAPFYNTLVMAKLALLGQGGIDGLRKAAGSTDKARISYDYNTILGDFASMDHGYKWENPMELSWFLLYSGKDDKPKIFDKIFSVSQNAATKPVTLKNFKLGNIEAPTSIKPIEKSGLNGPDRQIFEKDNCNVYVEYSMTTAKPGAKISIFRMTDMYKPEKALDSKTVDSNIEGFYFAPVPINDPGQYIVCMYNGSELMESTQSFEVTEAKDVFAADGTLLWENPEYVTFYNMQFGYWGRTGADGKVTGGTDLKVDYVARKIFTGTARMVLKNETDLNESLSRAAIDTVEGRDLKVDDNSIFKSGVAGVKSKRHPRLRNNIKANGSFYARIPVDKPGKYSVCLYDKTDLIGTSESFIVNSAGDVITSGGEVFYNMSNNTVPPAVVPAAPAATPPPTTTALPATPAPTTATAGAEEHKYPPVLTVSVEDGSIVLKWTETGDKKGLLGYYLYRSESEGYYGSMPINGYPLKELTYIDSNVRNGAKYYYIVKATYESGKVLGPVSNVVSDIAVKSSHPAVGSNGYTGVIYSWTGSWNTNWKDLKLTQDGAEVTGTFDGSKGTISGSLEGNVFTGIFFEGLMSGEITLMMSVDGKSLEGALSNMTGEDGTPGDDYEFSGDRI